MAWIYRDKSGALMFSKVKPEKVYIFRFKNCEIHNASESKYFTGDPNYVFAVKISECYFKHPGYYELKDFDGKEVLKKIYIKDAIFEGEYSMGFPVEFKPETIAALKPIVDLENFTIEDGLIEL